MLCLPFTSGNLASLLEWIEYASLLIEFIAVAIIIGSVIFGSVRFFYSFLVKKPSLDESFRSYKNSMGSLLLMENESIYQALEQAGIEMPNPIMTVEMKEKGTGS
jgi:hypothetical protein